MRIRDYCQKHIFFYLTDPEFFNGSIGYNEYWLSQLCSTAYQTKNVKLKKLWRNMKWEAITQSNGISDGKGVKASRTPVTFRISKALGEDA